MFEEELGAKTERYATENLHTFEEMMNVYISHVLRNYTFKPNVTQSNQRKHNRILQKNKSPIFM